MILNGSVSQHVEPPCGVSAYDNTEVQCGVHGLHETLTAKYAFLKICVVVFMFHFKLLNSPVIYIILIFIFQLL